MGEQIPIEFSDLLQQYQHDASGETLETMQKELESLRIKNASDLDKCKSDLDIKTNEMSQIEKKLTENKTKIQELEKEITNIETSIKALLSEAVKYEKDAAEFDNQATTSSKVGWGAVACGVSGLALAPFTGGLSAVLLSVVAPAGATGVAAVAFTDAANKRDNAKNNRKEAEDKRNKVKRKRQDIAKHQEKIDTDLIEKNNLNYEIPKVDKELEEIAKYIIKAKATKLKGKQNERYVTETLSWIEKHTADFKQAMASTYKNILERKEMDLNNQETKALIEILESTHKEIADMKHNIGDDMISRIHNIMKEQTVLKKLLEEVERYEQDIRELEKRLSRLKTQKDAFLHEADVLQELASEKEEEKNKKVKVGAGSAYILTLAAAAAPFTGGASLVAVGPSGAIAAYNLLSAYDCAHQAAQKKKQAEESLIQAEKVQREITKKMNEKDTRENQQKETTSLIV